MSAADRAPWGISYRRPDLRPVTFHYKALPPLNILVNQELPPLAIYAQILSSKCLMQTIRNIISRQSLMSRFRVLIMERDERVSRVLCRIIDKLGHDSFTAADYEHFKQLYAETKPDLILLSLDIENDADADAEFLRYLVGQKAEATVCLFGSTDDEYIASLSQFGQSARLKIGGTLRKPLDVDTLKAKLNELMPANPDDTLKKKLTANKPASAKPPPQKPVILRKDLTTS